MTKELLSRFVAAILLAFVFGFLGHRIEVAKLSRLQTMSLQESVDHEKQLNDHTYSHAVVVAAVFGSFYMFLLEVVAFVLRRGWRTSVAG